MNLLHLQYFQTVTLSKSLTEAAQKLHIPQPALSKTIAKLEEELGYSLFDRVGKRIALNAYGKTFLRYVNIALSALADAEKELAAMKDCVFPDICLNSEACFGGLTKLLADFHTEYPQIRFLLRKENVKENYPIRNYDLAIIMQPAEHPLPASSIVLFEEKLMLAVSEKHKFADRDSIDLIELKDENFVNFQQSSNYRDTVVDYCQSVGFRPNVALEVHDWHTLCDFVREDLCVAIVPEISWKSQYQGLKIIPIRAPQCARRLVLTWFDDSRLNISSTLFIEFCKKAFQTI